MKIAVLGTGMVGRTLAARLTQLGHEITIGTRNLEQTLSRAEPDSPGGTPYAAWHEANPGIDLATYDAAAGWSDLVVNATHGASSLAALATIEEVSIAGRVLLDLALPLDLSHGLPPKLLIANDNSLGEQIQRALPTARVVKALNTVYVEVMVDPGRVPGRHNLLIAGQDAAAKAAVTDLLGQFGWPAEDVIDLGGIQAARSAEMYMQLYFNLHSVLGTFDFNIAVIRA